MRLIDAEPLEQKLNEEYDELLNAYGIEGRDEFANGIRTATHCDLGYIKTAPTVEAIPIEWIIKWNEDYAPRDYREMTEDMIADWREEQGNES